MSARPPFGNTKTGGHPVPASGTEIWDGMADSPESTQEKASREATDWLILLQEEPNDPILRRRFDEWLKESPLHEAAWAATQRTASAIGATAPAYGEQWEPYVARKRDEGLKPISTPRRRKAAARRASAPAGTRRRGLRFAALAAIACLAFVIAPDLLLHVRADYRTGTADVRTLRLEDGSLVTLAPESAISVAYDAGKRRIRLLAGEAFFEVTPSPRRPFEVATQDVHTAVLGTAFNVIRDDSGVTVAVQHGTVRVDHEAASPSVSEVLEAGQLMTVSWTGRIVRDSRHASQIAAWRRGQLIAHDQTMGTVVAQLRRYYGGTIILPDSVLANRRVTGIYNLADPVSALNAIAQAHGATVRQIAPWVLVVFKT